MQLRVRVLAPPPAVHQALTDPDHMRVWLAEHAEVEPPDRYGFWGRYTPQGDAIHQRLLRLDENGLAFAWRIDGIDTTVEIGLSEEDGTTILALSHSNLPMWTPDLAESSTMSILHTFWALSVANLIDHVEGRPLTPRVDLTSPTMHVELLIHAARHDVYHSVVDPEAFARWFGAKVELEPHVGGRWAMGGFDHDTTPAHIVDLSPDRRFSVAFADGMVTTWELADSEGATRLTFTQSGFDAERPPYGAWLGWLGGIAELRRYHELPGWRHSYLDISVDGIPDGIITLPTERVD